MEKKEWPDFVAWNRGTCDCCYEEDVDVCGLGEDYFVCENCWYNELQLCDECGELWDPSAVDFILVDGRMICEHCAENINID